VMLPNGQPFSGNDSYWVDLGFPDQIGADGKKYRPLFAFFIMDMEGKVNVNAHGNMHGFNPNPPGVGIHASHQGLGAWEVNPGKVLMDPAGNPTGEWPALLIGTGSANAAPFMISGRYGMGAVTDKTTTTSPIAPNGFTPPIPALAPLYSRVNYNATTDAT